MATAGEQLMPQKSVQATLNYVIDTGEKLVTIPSLPGGEGSQNIGRYETRTVTVEDGRPLVAALSLDREGFALVRHDTKVTDFYDPQQIETVYNAEIEALIERETGAKEVVVFDHTLRAGDEGIRKEKLVREPVQRAHNDYTVRSGPKRVQDWFGEQEAEPLLKRRFAIINIWRSTAGSVEEFPLAVCDARTVGMGDLVISERRAKERIGETYRLAWNPAQRWFYFPAMTRNEAMLIKSYDSAEDGRARFTPHTAFADPATPADAPPRQSIETRVFAFF
jgi:hypothetical protein